MALLSILLRIRPEDASAVRILIEASIEVNTDHKRNRAGRSVKDFVFVSIERAALSVIGYRSIAVRRRLEVLDYDEIFEAIEQIRVIRPLGDLTIGRGKGTFVATRLISHATSAQFLPEADGVMMVYQVIGRRVGEIECLEATFEAPMVL